MAGQRLVVDNAVVAEYEGGGVVMAHRVNNHKRTYIWYPAQNRMTVTYRGKTHEIPHEAAA